MYTLTLQNTQIQVDDITPKLLWLLQPMFISYHIGNNLRFVDNTFYGSMIVPNGSKWTTFDDIAEAAIYIKTKQREYQEAMDALKRG